ncbi:MAG: D-alanyl-D-alanine carboxypeptidase family protein [Rhodospirillales bacterium]|jgi:D-alanyl-D-alanine carboxypeptidase
MATARRSRHDYSFWHRLTTVALAGAVSCLAAVPRQAHAQIGSSRYSSIVVEAGSGQLLESANPDAPRHPASLTKLMTLYMAFEALRDRRITLDQYVPISSHAASMSPTKLGLMPGTRITVDQAILGLVTKSANDAAAALGEMLGGSEDRFAQMMTLRARALGMTHTTFMNASGLPDPDQWTTARDMAILARRLISGFPGYYKYFSTPSFVWQRRVIANHDNLLRSYPGADGMKTGYTQASGYNLVSSAVRGGVRLVGVVLGASGAGERDAHMISLLDQGYGQLDIPTERAVGRGANHGLIGTAQAAPIDRHTTRARATEVTWGIQAGTHPTEKAARAAAQAARRIVEDGVAKTEPVTVNHKTVWRAQVMGLGQADARSACVALAKRKTACAVLRIDPRQIASR